MPREVHLGYLRAAEGQFRLATAVRLAVTFEHRPLDLPLQWLHGKHTVRYSEIALSREESDFAAWNLQRSATFPHGLCGARRHQGNNREPEGTQ